MPGPLYQGVPHFSKYLGFQKTPPPPACRYYVTRWCESIMNKHSKLRLFLKSTLRWLVVEPTNLKKYAQVKLGNIFPQFFGVQVVKNVWCMSPSTESRELFARPCWCEPPSWFDPMLTQDWQGQRCGRRTLRIGSWTQNPQKNFSTWDRRMSDPKKVTNKL